MAIIDKKQQAKDGIINTIKRTVEKTVSQSNFTRTILATIQYCVDKVNGQYKIKYQNGYLTAFVQNNSDGYMYSEGALVYVLVPNGDLTARLLIVGSASNNSGDKVYLTNLSDDQKYKTIGSNLLVQNGTLDLNLSSYWCGEGADEEFIKYYYQDEEQNGMFTINQTAIDNIKRTKYFRLGARFQTSFTDDRKLSGDYGIKLVAVFKKDDDTLEEKEYVLNTFVMNGTPFEFTDPVPQYCFWEVTNPDKLLKIKSVGGFVCNFPASEIENPPIDIKITDLSIYAAEQLYDVTNDVYRVQIDSPIADFTFKDTTSVDLMGRFYTRDIGEVQGDIMNDLEFYWAKKDCQVNSASHPRYSEVFKNGWYCLNPCTLKQSNDATIATLKENSTHTITSEEEITYKRSDLIYYTNVPTISLPIVLCQGKETIIKCAVKYNGNIYYSDERIVYNVNGYYVLVGAVDGKKKSQNGDGYFTIGAGIFKDVDGEDTPNNSITLDNKRVSYKWVQIQNGVRKEVPPTNRSDIASLLLNIEGWDYRQDNETIAYTNPDDNEFLHNNPELILCADRYNYYNTRKSADISSVQKARCRTRSNQIITDRKAQIQSYYASDYENQSGYYITGPSEVTAKYLTGGQREAINAEVDSVTPQFDSQVNVQNTLYQIPAWLVNTVVTYEVSAIVDGYDIGRAEITLVNEAGNALDYSIDITNGRQTYLYDERGISPCAESSNQPISISPLSFVLYNKEGEKLYDSAAPESYPDVDIGQLRPVWRFVDAEYSLLSTNYQKPNGSASVEGGKYASKSKNFSTSHVWELRKEAQFYYTLQDNYDPNSVSNSNIELELIYDGQEVFGSTSFVFSKQGELGTNGTNRALTIYSPPYTNNYKESILSDPIYCYFNPKRTVTSLDQYIDSAMRYFGPNSRHLSNPYMFATDSYNSLAEGSTPCSREDGRYVNLYLAQGPGATEDKIGQSSTASYQAIWSNNPNEAASNSDNFNWSIEQAKTIEEANGSIVGTNVTHYRNLISINGSDSESAVSIQLRRTDDNPTLSNRPLYEVQSSSKVDKYYPNNIIRASAETTTSDGRTIKNYAFCTIPYYYINWTYHDGGGTMPAGVDPARHIILVGGFDQIMYDSTGHNPTYNSQTPFQFYLFDKDNHDITFNVVRAALNHDANVSIEWDASPGLQINYKGFDAINQILSFNTLSGLIQKGALCYQTVDNVKYYYKCIKQHKKEDTNNVSNGDGTKTAYPAGSFVPAYWTEIDPISYCQTMEVTPASVYESMYESNLFNSWVRLRVRYKKYEAEAIIPINIYCNSYESPELNGWDGKTLTMEDGEDQSYLIANKVSAGIKDDNNRFIGISIGENIRYESRGVGRGDKKVSSVGLFGFGQGYDGTGRTQQTLFLNAKTGLAAFGPSGASQIVLNPNPEKWSRLAGWYFSKDFLYKPVGGTGKITDSTSYKRLASDEDIVPPNDVSKSFGIYVPSEDAINEETVVMWAGTQTLSNINSKPRRQGEFWLTYGGKLHATEAEITGKITATSGEFGSRSDKVSINVTDDNHTYVLKHKDFWVETENTSSETGDQGKKTTVGIRGNIMAESGQIGSTRSNLNGYATNAIFLYYKWYKWHLPADNEAFIPEREGGPTPTYYLEDDTGQSKNTTYLLYHPNFSVTRGGDVRLNGKIFTEEGRIGGWVIKNDRLKSYTGNVNICSDGHANFGSLYINPNGSIGGPTWSINENGVASFTNPDNTYVGSSVRIGNGVWGQGGLVLPEGEHFKIGNTADMTATSSGFVFTGNSTYNGRLTMGTGQTLALESGATLNFGTGLNLDSSGIHIGAYSIDNSGQANLQNVTVGNTLTTNIARVNSLYIGNTSLEDYILRYIQMNIGISYLPKVTVATPGGGSVAVVDHVSLTWPT